ncbi:MAG: hypothetical protein HY376_00350 [Candidatus Blackburnbacteria bacterium]|nr:hypothetical protein [Candidatus Blackburnbacteria bacterium]
MPAEVGSSAPSEFISHPLFELPTVLRDTRGQVRWTFPGNSPEENLQLGISNVQGLFLERYPEFSTLFPRNIEGKIDTSRRDAAERFIRERIVSTGKFGKNISWTPVHKENTPYFKDYQDAINKSFSLWGIDFEPPPHPQEGKPIVLRDLRDRIQWSLPNKTEEQNLKIGINNIQAIFLEKFPEFEHFFPRDKSGKIQPEKVDEAREFILDKLGSKEKFVEILGASPLRQPYFGTYRVAIEKSFKPLGIAFPVGTDKGTGVYLDDNSKVWVQTGKLSRDFGLPLHTIRTVLRTRDVPSLQSLDSSGRRLPHYDFEKAVGVLGTYVALPKADVETHRYVREGDDTVWVAGGRLAKELGLDPVTVYKLTRDVPSVEVRDSTGRPQRFLNEDEAMFKLKPLLESPKAPMEDFYTDNSGKTWLSENQVMLEYGISRDMARKYLGKKIGHVLLRNSKGMRTKFYNDEDINRVFKEVGVVRESEEKLSSDEADRWLKELINN